MLDLTLFHTVWRYTHIVVGLIGLIAFWIPIFATKGSVLHMRAGTVFVLSGYVVAVTALISAGWGLVGAKSFMMSRGVASEHALEAAKQNEFVFALLFFLAMGVLVGLRMGVRLVQTKNTPEQLATRPLKALYIAYGITGVALCTYGIARIYTEGVSGRYILCVVLGCVGVLDCREIISFFVNPRPTPMEWWYRHMQAMIGCGIGFHTAFLIFGLGRFVRSGLLPEQFTLVAMFLPAAIGIPAAYFWVHYYKRRFKEVLA